MAQVLLLILLQDHRLRLLHPARATHLLAPAVSTPASAVSMGTATGATDSPGSGSVFRASSCHGAATTATSDTTTWAVAVRPKQRAATV